MTEKKGEVEDNGEHTSLRLWSYDLMALYENVYYYYYLLLL